MADVSPSVVKIYSQEQNTQPFGPLTSVQAFDFDTEEQLYQAALKNKNFK